MTALTSRTVDRISNFKNPFVHLEEDKAVQKCERAHTEFLKKLQTIQDEIDEKNKKREHPYFYLRPVNIDVSLAI